MMNRPFPPQVASSLESSTHSFSKVCMASSLYASFSFLPPLCDTDFLLQYLPVSLLKLYDIESRRTVMFTASFTHFPSIWKNTQEITQEALGKSLLNRLMVVPKHCVFQKPDEAHPSPVPFGLKSELGCEEAGAHAAWRGQCVQLSLALPVVLFLTLAGVFM